MSEFKPGRHLRVCRTSAHPDRVLHLPDREPTPSRHQFVLNFAREDVREGVLVRARRLLSGHRVDFVKWDHNRPYTEVGWPQAPAPDRPRPAPDRRREVPRRGAGGSAGTGGLRLRGRRVHAGALLPDTGRRNTCPRRHTDV
ncbi:alpha-galactosidase [Saccharothrix yanglingensis]|uniref:alpha-galactosidase n=1 Tax=Saccharothrix yanglingensis TaxID=659496 RepID=UPI003527EF52